MSRLLRGLDLFVGAEQRTRAGVNVSCWLAAVRVVALATCWGPRIWAVSGCKNSANPNLSHHLES
jgi:hypothetical protein